MFCHASAVKALFTRYNMKQNQSGKYLVLMLLTPPPKKKQSTKGRRKLFPNFLMRCSFVPGACFPLMFSVDNFFLIVDLVDVPMDFFL